MPRDAALLALRFATLCAIAASAALVVEYRSIDPSFCAVGSGCALLRRTDLAHLWGLGASLPEAALVLFSVLFSLSLTRYAKWSLLLAMAGGLIGLVLLGLQAIWIKSFCWLCVVTDASAVLAGGFGFIAWRAPEGRVGWRIATWAWAGLALLAIAAPAAWPWLKPAPSIPVSIRAFYRPGKINVIEFADFECPFCRALHERLKGLLEPYGERLHFVRLNMPLESHTHARGAALAEICARPSGKAAMLAEFLFTTENLSQGNILREAARLGLDARAFQTCVASPATAHALEREMSVLREVGFQGLPTTYIGARRIVGAQSDDTFSDALERASRAEDERGIPGFFYLFCLLLAGATLVRFGLKAPEAAGHADPSLPTRTPA